MFLFLSLYFIVIIHGSHVIMSRVLSQSLHRPALRPPTAAIITHHRHRSTKTNDNNAHLIEVIDVDQASSSSESAAEVITFGIKKLEDAIHRIIVRRAAPDWLPFRPGYSYWVPPRVSALRDHHAGSMIEALGKLNSMNRGSVVNDMLSEDEDMAFTSTKGWPSSAFFIEGTSPIHPIPVVEVEVKIQDNEVHADEETSNSEDAEG